MVHVYIISMYVKKKSIGCLVPVKLRFSVTLDDSVWLILGYLLLISLQIDKNISK